MIFDTLTGPAIKLLEKADNNLIRKIFESELEAYCNGAMESMTVVPVLITALIIILGFINGGAIALARGFFLFGVLFAILLTISIVYRKTWIKNTAVHFLKRKSIYELFQSFKSIKLKNIGWYYKSKIE